MESGNVTEIKLRCQKQYLAFKFDPDLRYDIEGKNGNCSIEVLGSHDTRSGFVQS